MHGGSLSNEQQVGRSNDGRVLRVLEEPETSRGWLDCGGKMRVEGLVSNTAGVKL